MYIHIYMYAYIYIYTAREREGEAKRDRQTEREIRIDARVSMLDSIPVHGGEDSSEALSCRSYFAKGPLIIRLVCGK